MTSDSKFKKRILYCFAGGSIFGFRDVKMFQAKYDVIACNYKILVNPLRKWLSFLWYNLRVLRNVLRTDIVIINFGAWHSIVPVYAAKWFGKKSLVILGGFDAGNIPSLNYGVFCKPGLLQYWMKKTYKAATWICPVSDALVKSINTYADPAGEGYKVGLLHFIPEVRDKIKVIHTDYNADFWSYHQDRRNRDILALAYIHNELTFELKGYDLMMKAAQMMPEYSFTFAGFTDEMINKYKSVAPGNVTFKPYQSTEKIKDLYQEHKVFVIPSLTEGLPNTLCEAMLCGCIPVGSDVGVIPWIIGDAGPVIHTRKMEAIQEAIVDAISNSNYAPQRSRQRIVGMFPEGSRLDQFIKLIEAS